jgi:hypothetical protein
MTAHAIWMNCRGPMGGYAHLPDGGGLNDQSCWLMVAFDVMSGAKAELEKVRG